MVTKKFLDTIVLFDGICNLCNEGVNFIIDHDPRKEFKFASLQSDAGIGLLKRAALPIADLSTIVLYDNGKFYTKSSAVLRIAGKLSYPWRLAKLLLVVPPFVRDPAYNFIGRNRYRWFGTKDACRVPTPELRERFL